MHNISNNQVPKITFLLMYFMVQNMILINSLMKSLTVLPLNKYIGDISYEDKPTCDIYVNTCYIF